MVASLHAQVSHELRTCSAEDQLQILQKYEKYLTAGVGHFRQPSAASKALIQGTAPSEAAGWWNHSPVSEVASAVLQLSADLVRRWWGPTSGSCSPRSFALTTSPPFHLFQVLDEVQAYIILARSSRHWVRDRGESYMILGGFHPHLRIMLGNSSPQR